VVTHQLQVERRTAKGHRPKTDALWLDYATNGSGYKCFILFMKTKFAGDIRLFTHEFILILTKCRNLSDTHPFYGIVCAFVI